MLILAKEEGFDAFTALGIAGLPEAHPVQTCCRAFLLAITTIEKPEPDSTRKDLLGNKFVKGTGTLRCAPGPHDHTCCSRILS